MRRTVVLGLVVAALWVAAGAVWARQCRDETEPSPAYRLPTVVVDPGVDVEVADATAVIGSITNDPRGWRTDLDGLTVRIAPPGIKGVERMGGTIGRAHLSERLAVISAEAWVTLGPKFAATGGTLEDQRAWIVLHEIGHLLGHAHQECAGSGPAPVMRPVNYELGHRCVYNVWPNP